MKNKLLFFLMIINISLLSSCVSKMDDKQYEIINYTNIYAYNIEKEDIEMVSIDYEINDPIDVFLLYSIDQNILPYGYTSKCYSNVGIIECKILYDDVYYIVDKYIINVADIDIFSQLLTLGVRKLGYKNAYIMYNNTLITKNDTN